jgi:hypothetical protein
MVGQYLPKKSKFTFCYSVLKKQNFLTTKQGLSQQIIFLGKVTYTFHVLLRNSKKETYEPLVQLIVQMILYMFII